MLWVILIGAVLAFFVLRALTKSRTSELEAGAAYESIKKTEPESELGQLSENEFRLLYMKCSKARSTAVPGIGFFGFILSLLLAIAFIDDTRDGQSVVFAFLFAVAGGVAAGVISNLKLPKISTIMRNQLKHKVKQSKF